MENYIFTTDNQGKPQQITEYNTLIVWTDEDDRVRILPTMRAQLKYRTRHITAPVRWFVSIPQRYALY